MEYKDKRVINLNEESLEAVTAGYGDANDYYDPFRCFVPMPNGSRCHIRNGGVRCRHLSIETKTGDQPEKHRYICAKGCFDYLSNFKLQKYYHIKIRRVRSEYVQSCQGE